MKKLSVGQKADDKLGKLHNPEMSQESVVWANFLNPQSLNWFGEIPNTWIPLKSVHMNAKKINFEQQSV